MLSLSRFHVTSTLRHASIIRHPSSIIRHPSSATLQRHHSNTPPNSEDIDQTYANKRKVKNAANPSPWTGPAAAGAHDAEIKMAAPSTNFPSFIHKWNREKFYYSGGILTASTSIILLLSQPSVVFSGILLSPVALYWYLGLQDIRQQSHAVLRNFPLLGRVRYFLESIRPEIRQYLVESDSEAVPFSRLQRSIVYSRAKGQADVLPFGTRRDVYGEGYEWLNHSLFPVEVPEANRRVMIGRDGSSCTQPYSAALLNISAMSYGALSENAILALNGGAKLGGFYHNTGEGGLSRHHLAPGGDIVWNVGSGYFGCRNPDGTFNHEKFIVNATRPQVKMIELKLSQGAKPGHGGVLPGKKVTPTIAEARGVNPGEDCISPARHSAFRTPVEMMKFIEALRGWSGGKPVGFKLCVGRPEEIAALISAMLITNVFPDFITVDGGEGGTGAAPPEYSNSVGWPLVDGLSLVHCLLTGAGVRDRVKLICAGKVTSGFSIVRNLAIGADLCNAARAFMFSLGCIQALSCGSNTCPTGIATQDPKLMKGLVVADKVWRVYNFQKKTVESAFDLIGSAGLTSPSEVQPWHVYARTSKVGYQGIQTYAELYPPLPPGCLVSGAGSGFPALDRIWAMGRQSVNASSSIGEMRLAGV